MFNKKDKEKLYELYFERMFSYSQIIAYFGNRYSYAEIKSAIMKKLK